MHVKCQPWSRYASYRMHMQISHLSCASPPARTRPRSTSNLHHIRAAVIQTDFDTEYVGTSRHKSTPCVPAPDPSSQISRWSQVHCTDRTTGSTERRRLLLMQIISSWMGAWSTFFRMEEVQHRTLPSKILL
jgi:hypothetical protein